MLPGSSNLIRCISLCFLLQCCSQKLPVTPPQQAREKLNSEGLALTIQARRWSYKDTAAMVLDEQEGGCACGNSQCLHCPWDSCTADQPISEDVERFPCATWEVSGWGKQRAISSHSPSQHFNKWKLMPGVCAFSFCTHWYTKEKMPPEPTGTRWALSWQHTVCTSF